MKRRQFFSFAAGFVTLIAGFFPGSSKIDAAPLSPLELPPLPDCSNQWPVRFDLAFRVPGPVWKNFCILRDKWDGWIAINGFHQDCEAATFAALQRHDRAAALHWRTVQELAVWYAHIPTAAIEVNGRVLREVPFPSDDGFQQFSDADLERIYIGSV